MAIAMGPTIASPMGRSVIDPSQSYEDTRERARCGTFSPTTVSHRTADIEFPTPPTIRRPL
jgi:hypothetical protein